MYINNETQAKHKSLKKLLLLKLYAELVEISEYCENILLDTWTAVIHQIFLSKKNIIIIP